MSEKIKKTPRQKLLDLTFIALFAALCYIALTVFFFPFAQMYIHFGNLIVVVAALLVGGWQGGLAGSVGMGLFDILNGHADSAPKTFLLKFLIGITVGAVFTLFKNRKSYPATALWISGAVSILIAAALAIPAAKSGYEGKTVVLCPLFIVVGLICFFFALLKNKFPQKTASAIVAASCGMMVNIIGETLWKIVQFSLAGSSVSAATAAAVLAQGSTLINAGIAVIGGVALYSALEKPFAKLKKI
ncbi:MAG: ECF transporter S component [Acutalibacteraceae bacterium]|jgi:uncharacterized membrane protein